MSDKKLNKEDGEVIDSYSKLMSREDPDNNIPGKSLEQKEKKLSPFDKIKQKASQQVDKVKQKASQQVDKVKQKASQQVERAKINLNEGIANTTSLFSKIMNYGTNLLDNDKKIINNNAKLFDVKKKINATSDGDQRDKLELEKEKLEVERDKLELECHEFHQRHHRIQKDKKELSDKEKEKLKELEKKKYKSSSEIEEEDKLRKKEIEYQKHEKSENFHKDKGDEKVENNKENIERKIETNEERTKKLREIVKNKFGEAKEKAEKKLEDLKHHLSFLRKEAKDVLKNKVNRFVKQGETFFERFLRKCESEEVSAFIFFCAVSVFVFAAAGLYALNSSDFRNANKNSKKYTSFIVYSGIVYFILFTSIIAISFGEDKDIKKKIASFILLLGSYFVGLYYVYLKSQGKISDLTGTENLASSLAVVVTAGFLLFSIYFDLFDSNKVGSKLTSNLRIAYLFLSLILFFGLGGIMTVLTFKTNYDNDGTLKLLFPLSAGLFFLGLLGVLGLILAYFKKADKFIDKFIEKGLHLVEWFRFKIIIMLCFIMTIFYTYLLYESSYSDSINDSKLNDQSKIDFRNNVIQKSFIAGLCLISFFLIMLGITFGGTLKEKIFTVFLLVFITFVGTLLLYLDDDKKIKDLTTTQRATLTGIEVVFVVLLITAIYYVLFMAQTTEDKILTSLAKISIIIGVVLFFIFTFAIIATTLFWLSPEGSLKTELWTGFGAGIAVLAASGFLLY